MGFQTWLESRQGPQEVHRPQGRLPTHAQIEREARANLPVVLEPEVISGLPEVVRSVRSLLKCQRNSEQETCKGIALRSSESGIAGASWIECPRCGSNGIINRVLPVPEHVRTEPDQVHALAPDGLRSPLPTLRIELQRSAA